MSNKSSGRPPQQHKSIEELIAEERMKEAQRKQDLELRRQKEVVNTTLVPFLEETTESITDAKVLVNNTIKVLNDIFKEKMEEERERLSATSIEKLDISERLERDKSKNREKCLIEKLKDERIATVVSVLGTLYVAVSGVEAKENSSRKLKCLKIEV